MLKGLVGPFPQSGRVLSSKLANVVAFVGVFLAGPITNRLGYRWTTLLALVLMNATIFISFFVSTLAQGRASCLIMFT